VEQEDGTVKTETRFANAYYDEKGNRIVVNPEARISQEKALFHELDHALRSFFGGGTPAIYKGALDSLDDTTKAALKEQYGSNEAIFNDEANAFYAAEVMGEKGFARSIATTKPKAFEKIMNFFKDAINYKNDGYSKAARKYYKEYKAMYEAFSAVNKGNNALEGAEGGKRYSYSSIDITPDRTSDSVSDRTSDATRGFYINDSSQAFTEQILNGEKTIETREQPKNRKYPELHKYIGKRIGIVRSGKGKTSLVGFATIAEEIVYNTEAEFRADEDKHLVKKGSAYDIKNKKYG
jgi:hypothetical protein